ncbi:unnamed protein product [Owenia fusiformis]|uniref:Uncharacterized protein n=1 Tax=Owenia fusiformis TaxID=6347 RepID=A0A8S4Q2D9_OWEFU|nr:unnamed protein product [Owenia fusiformis]
MYLMLYFRRRAKGLAIGLTMTGLFVVFLKTSIYEGVETIQGGVFKIEIKDSVSNESLNFRNMANIDRRSSNFTSPAAIPKQDGGKAESEQLKTVTLKQLIETNKNIYENDSKEKQLSDTFLRALNRSYKDVKKQSFDSCKNLISEIKLRHEIKYFVFRYGYDPLPIDVTILSHITLNRGIDRIATILAKWPGPASISVFGTDDEIKTFLHTTHSWKRNNIGIHVVYQRNARYYPVNFMRNVALYGANTSHIWMIDADFTPNKDAYQLIKKHIHKFNWNASRPALVTPAFETNLTEGGVPDNKTQLLEKLKQKNRTIHTFSFARCPGCHSSTNWSHFMKATKTYKV